MALEKVLGIETEYGVIGGPDRDPITASTLVVSAYARRAERVEWDFGAESPDLDARGLAGLGALAPVVEPHLANAVLRNGARLYVDHAHPEYSSPECRTPLEATVFDLAGEEVLRRAQAIANDDLDVASAITVYKNNSDGKGNSYGCHENYLVARDIPFVDVVRAMVPHLVSRQVILGAGKVGAETDVGQRLAPDFQISQRAEFFEEVVGLETTLRRPIVNTRDEPHGDPERFRRLHVIIGDANRSATATFVKLGATALLLALLEDEGPRAFPPPPVSPVRAVREIAADPTLRTVAEMEDGRRLTGWDLQDLLFRAAERYVARGGGAAVASEDEVRLLLTEWRAMLDGVRDDPASVADRVDWVAKRRLVEGYRSRHDLPATHARLRAIDLQYHDLRPERSLADRAGLRPLVDVAAMVRAVAEPPESTRAYFRGRCVALFPEAVVAANWDSVVFDVGEGPLRRVPMSDPRRGTAALTEALFAQSPTAVDLLRALGG